LKTPFESPLRVRLVLLALLALLLGGCLETKAKLTWHEDGSIDLSLSLEGDALKSDGELIVERLAAGGFSKIRLKGGELTAEEKFKEAGWDRLSGWLPGRLAYHDPSGLTFSRKSWVVFEDYALSGRLDVGRVAQLPPFTAALGLPFTFEVEAPWPALASNADEVRGRVYVWKRTLGQPFQVRLVYRRWFPERVLAVLLVLILLSLVLWRRLRPRPRD